MQRSVSMQIFAQGEPLLSEEN